MSKAKRAAPLYQRGKYKLDWDRRRDGSLRSPFLTVFWYDPAKRRIRSASTGETDGDAAKRWLDAHYLKTETGQSVCPTCGQVRSLAASYLVTEAIEAYLLDNEEKASAKALRSRLNHVLDYIATLPDPAVQAAAVDDRWVGRFRSWLIKQPIVSPKGHKRQRSLSTVETSVAQLAAAINHAKNTRQIVAGANFKLIQFKDVNQTPKHRSDIEELAAMFCYAQGYPSLHRFLAFSVATLCRPDAAHDFNVDGQWKGNIINLKKPHTAQTKKVRPEVPSVRQIKPVLDSSEGWFVGVKSVRRSWEKMADTLGLPQDREGGMKLIRRSMAALLRGRLPAAEWTELEIWLGHRAISEISALYAPDRPDYLAKCKAGIEAIIDEIEQFVPLAFAGLAPEKVVAPEAETV